MEIWREMSIFSVSIVQTDGLEPLCVRPSAGIKISKFKSIFFISIWMHYNDIIMGTMASQITGVSVVYSTVCSGADQRKHYSSVSLLWGEFTGYRWIPTQMAINAENVSIWWHHHGTFMQGETWVRRWYICENRLSSVMTKFGSHIRVHTDIFNMGSWNHMGCTESMIIKDFVRQMCIPLENSAYFGDGDSVIRTLHIYVGLDLEE